MAERTAQSAQLLSLSAHTLGGSSSSSTLAPYAAKGPSPSFDVLARFSVEPTEEPDFDAYEMVLSNCNPAFAIVDGRSRCPR